MISDRFLAFLMLIFALELQDYTFGFAGINLLWEELNGFPRGVALLLGPMMYFYLCSQININWQFGRKDLWHLIPWSIGFLFNLVIFLGGEEFVTAYQSSKLSYYQGFLLTLVRWLSYGYYFYHSIRLYRAYRTWIDQSFSELETISLSWFRNFIYLMLFWVSFREFMIVLDFILKLDFYQDWWWNLVLVGVAVYVGISGLSQAPASRLSFTRDKEVKLAMKPKITAEHKEIIKRLDHSMQAEKLFLQSQLNLRDLAQHLKVPGGLLSAAINSQKKVNFNDYINALRVDEFLTAIEKEGSHAYTLLALALDCGFNSKATFNRAFKKEKGLSPREYLSTIKK